MQLAWLMESDPLVFPIPGTTKTKNFDENMGSLKVSISKEEDAEIRKAISNAEVQGGRYVSRAGAGRDPARRVGVGGLSSAAQGNGGSRRQVVHGYWAPGVVSGGHDGQLWARPACRPTI